MQFSHIKQRLLSRWLCDAACYEVRTVYEVSVRAFMVFSVGCNQTAADGRDAVINFNLIFLKLIGVEKNITLDFPSGSSPLLIK